MPVPSHRDLLPTTPFFRQALGPEVDLISRPEIYPQSPSVFPQRSEAPVQTRPTLTGAGLCHPAVPAEVDGSQGPPEKPRPLFMSPGWFSVLPHTDQSPKMKGGVNKRFLFDIPELLRQSQGWINSGQGPKVASTESIKMANLPELGHVRTSTACGEGIRPRMESSARDSIPYGGEGGFPEHTGSLMHTTGAAGSERWDGFRHRT